MEFSLLTLNLVFARAILLGLLLHPQYAEARALLEALVKLQQLQLTGYFVIFTDCASLIQDYYTNNSAVTFGYLP